MKKALGLWICAGLILLLALPAAALDFGARAAYWIPASDEATIRVDNGSEGTTFDFKDDLGVGKSAFPWVEAWFGLGRHSLTLGYFQVENSGDETLGSSADFRGFDFSNRHVDFESRFRSTNLTYGYRILDASVVLAGLTLTALFDVRYLDIYSEMEATALSVDVTQRAIIASVGAKARVSLLANLIWGRAVVLVEPIGTRNLGDIILEVGVSPVPLLDLHLGWRTLMVRIDENDFDFNRTFQGPFLGVSLSW